MGSPDTYDICKNCHEPVKQVNNTGPYVHVVSHLKGTGTPDTECVNPRLAVEQKSVAGRTTGNYKTATKNS